MLAPCNCRSARDRYELHRWLERFLDSERRRSCSERRSATRTAYGCVVAVPGWSSARPISSGVLTQPFSKPQERLAFGLVAVRHDRNVPGPQGTLNNVSSCWRDSRIALGSPLPGTKSVLREASDR